MKIFDKEKLLIFAIEEVMGRKLNTNKWEEYVAMMDMVEETFIAGTGKETLTTCLKAINTPELSYFLKQYSFSIHGSQTTLYSHTSSLREAAILHCVGEYCKDLLVDKMMNKKSK